MNFYKPIFKKILLLKEIPFFNYKIFKFKRKKWKNFSIDYEKILKFKLIDQNTLVINQYSNKYNSYKNEYKNLFFSLKNFTSFYLNILKTKTIILKKKCNKYILNYIESRIDFILLRTKFSLNIRFIHRIIKNGQVYVNNTTIKTKSFILISGDFINFYIKNYEKTLVYSIKWILPLKNTIVNYNIKEILYQNNLKILNLTCFFPFYLKLIKLFYCFYSSMVEQLAVN